MSKVAGAWASTVNANGGINGHPVQLTVLDDDTNPATALQDAKKLVADHVIAIVGEVSEADAAWASYISSKGIPVVGGIDATAAFLSNPDFYPSGSQLIMQTYGMLALAKKEGKSNLSVMYCAEEPTCAQVVPLVEGAAAVVGLTSKAQKISSTAPSYAAPCLTAKGGGADSLFVYDNSTVVQHVVSGCAQQGFKPLTVSQATTATNAWLTDSNLSGAVLSGFNANPYDSGTPGVQACQAALDKYASGVRTSRQFNADAMMPWAGGKLFEAAAKAGNIGPSSTAADVKKGLYALKNETLGGLTGPLTVTPK
jgi:branched-chain amino acid transport system substrate-binding protein